ncbi:hypothetical protein Q5741_21155, partial [Paenibacillus sp. JX-17]|nr:hypothetical protein [Paenibacillus sp. JX-17]
AVTSSLITGFLYEGCFQTALLLTTPDGTLIAISISEVGFAVPFARLPCTTISSLICPTYALLFLVSLMILYQIVPV